MTDTPSRSSSPATPRAGAFRWPGDRRIAAIANIAFEAWGDGHAPGIGPMGNPLPSGAFDTNARSLGDYGADHGVHRLLRILARAQIRGSVMVSGILADRFPANVQAIADAGHEIIAHGYSQDLVPASLSESEDKHNIEKTTVALERVTGQRPFGWASPRNTPGEHTIKALAEAGYRWHSDAMNADLPYEQTFGTSSIIAIPFGMDINDLPHAMRFGRTPRQYIEMFDDLLEHASDHSDEPLIIDVTAHAHNYGRPGGAWAYENVVNKLAERSDIWLATRAEVTDHFQQWSDAQ